MISWADVLRAELEEQDAVATLAAATHARIKTRLAYHLQSDAERADANLATRMPEPTPRFSWDVREPGAE